MADRVSNDKGVPAVENASRGQYSSKSCKQALFGKNLTRNIWIPPICRTLLSHLPTQQKWGGSAGGLRSIGGLRSSDMQRMLVQPVATLVPAARSGSRDRSRKRSRDDGT